MRSIEWCHFQRPWVRGPFPRSTLRAVRLCMRVAFPRKYLQLPSGS